MTDLAPLPVCIELVQYTPRRDGMVLQVSAADPTHPQSPLIGTSRLIQTTQRAVAGTADATLADVDWGDDDNDAFVISYFATMGLTVTVVPNYLPGDAPAEAPAPPEEEPPA